MLQNAIISDSSVLLIDNYLTRKEVKKREIVLVGRTEGDEPCEACLEADKVITEKIKNSNSDKVEYKKIQADSEEGRKIAEDEDVEGLPFIRDCKIYEDGKKKCREIEGFDEEDWMDLDKI